MLPRFYFRLLIILATLAFLPIIYGRISAENFSGASILLLRSVASTPTTALICVTTPSNDNGTENNLRITFPTTFTVSSNTANWTVNTSNLPADSTPWPGIGVASSVSGKTVTFPSSNLSTNTKYCFRTSSTTSLTTASTTGSHKGAISTYQGSSIIDRSEFGLNVNADQVTINGVVPANPTDFESEMDLTNPSGNNFPQDTTLTYTLTYGSNLAYPTNIVVEAEWSLGTISGSGTPTVQVVDYVVGSASSGYNSTPPVIDLVNRKIVWTINSFPANTTGETVTFQLRTNDNYTGNQTVSFNVSGRVIGPGTQTPDSTVTRNYLYDPTLVPTPTPTVVLPTATPQPDTSSTPSIQATSTPTPPAAPTSKLTIDEVEIRGISPTTADIFLSLSQNGNVIIQYGTSFNNLVNEISSSENASEYLIFLRNLEPNTQYFYRIIASNDIQSITSEIYTFTTALEDTQVLIINKSFMVISNDLLIYSQSLADEKKIAPLTIIPTNTKFTFSVAFENSNKIKSIQAFLRKKFVLSSNTVSTGEIQNLSLIETLNGEYTGQLDSGIETNLYELFFRISDTSGNIFEQKAGDFKIVNPLTVLEKESLKPVEGARVKIYVYNYSTRIYEEVNRENLPIDNPELTFSDGTTDIILPQGRYRAEVSAFLHEDIIVDFVLGEKTDENYPTIYLERKPFDLLSLLFYFGETASDYYNLATDFIERLANSNRVFELVAFLIISIFVFVAFISLLLRTHNTPKSVLHYIHHIIKKRSFNLDKPLKGIIKDKTNKSLSKAIVSFLKNNEVVFQTSTNISGIFYTNGKDFDSIEVNKVGYQSTTFPFGNQLDEKVPVFHLSQQDGFVKSTFRNIFDTLNAFIGLLFEVIILILFGVELLFIPAFGIIKVLPYLIITFILLSIFIHQNILSRKIY